LVLSFRTAHSADPESSVRPRTGLLAASAARPSGHSLRECSLRHPAFAVRVPPAAAPEWR